MLLNQIYYYLYNLKRIFLSPRYPISCQENYAPFFIIGSGRSGNTLLRRILFSHSKIFIPPETYVLGDVIKTFEKNQNMEWSKLVFLTLSTFEYYPEFETFNISLRPLANKLIHVHKKYRSLSYILDSLYRYSAVLADQKCKFWGDKTPNNTFHLEKIINVFPDAKFIHIVRDGCDVVSSYLESGIYNNINEAAERWLTSTRMAILFSKKYSRSCIEVKYENLVRNPKDNVEKLCNFLEIEYEDNMLTSSESIQSMGDILIRKHHENVCKEISTSSIGKGKAKLSQKDKIILDNLIGEHLKELGYKIFDS